MSNNSNNLFTGGLLFSDVITLKQIKDKKNEEVAKGWIDLPKELCYILHFDSNMDVYFYKTKSDNNKILVLPQNKVKATKNKILLQFEFIMEDQPGELKKATKALIQSNIEILTSQLASTSPTKKAQWRVEGLWDSSNLRKSNDDNHRVLINKLENQININLREIINSEKKLNGNDTGRKLDISLLHPIKDILTDNILFENDYQSIDHSKLEKKPERMFRINFPKKVLDHINKNSEKEYLIVYIDERGLGLHLRFLEETTLLKVEYKINKYSNENIIYKILESIKNYDIKHAFSNTINDDKTSFIVYLDVGKNAKISQCKDILDGMVADIRKEVGHPKISVVKDDSSMFKEKISQNIDKLAEDRYMKTLTWLAILFPIADLILFGKTYNQFDEKVVFLIYSISYYVIKAPIYISLFIGLPHLLKSAKDTNEML